MTNRIIRLPEVKARTGVSRSTIYRHIDAGLFPKPVSLGARAVGWFEGQVDEWIESRATASIPAAKLERNHG